MVLRSLVGGRVVSTQLRGIGLFHTNITGHRMIHSLDRTGGGITIRVCCTSRKESMAISGV